MEQINFVHLAGHIGSVKHTNTGNGDCIRFSVATSVAYKDHDGSAIIETTWHNCVFFGQVDGIEKGSAVDLEGRIRQIRYTALDGEERVINEIIVSKVSVVKDGSLGIQKLN